MQSQFCTCCGERWSSWMNDDEREEEPMIYDIKVKEKCPDECFSSSTIIYYYDGTKEKLWYKKEE